MTIAPDIHPQTRDPECVVLEGGPRAGEWFYVRDWDIRCMSATAMGRSARDVQGWTLGYRRTTRTTAHPDEKLRYEAAVWRWVGPPAPGAPRVDA